MKKYYFLSGLPRSGSTLLCNILLQNPNIYASATSGLVDIMIPIKNGWNQVAGFRAMEREESETRLKNTLCGCIQGYYRSVCQPIVIDKSRAWLQHIPTIEAVLDEPVKIIVTVRDLRQVMASLEKLYRKTSALGITSQEASSPQDFTTIESRCKFWARSDQLVGASLNSIRHALECGYVDRLHFVDFENLTKAPKATLEGIYNFLNVDQFDHDFDNVEQKTREDDRTHGWAGLHDIRQKVEFMTPDYDKVLGQSLGKKFAKQELW